MPYPNIFSKYWYYLCSVITLLIKSDDPLRTIKIFILPEDHQRKTVRLNGLRFTIRSKMDLWTLKETILDRCYEQEFIKFENGWQIVDIGGAFGDFSVWIAKNYPNSKVSSFEPHPDSFELAQMNIKANGLNNIDLQNKAVGSSNLVKDLRFNPKVLPGSVSLCGAPQVLNDQNAKIHKVTFVSLKDILSNLPSVDLIKIDCEGGEYDILLNSPEEVIKKIHHVAMEWHDGIVTNNHQDLVKRLNKCGFDVKVRLNPVHANIGLLFAINESLHK